ncbi:hypothetical protein ACFQ2T_07590 [Methylophilus flavus]|jgi:hypothetical protein|uniref:FlxA-like family protein n=1 Tax=Methylophilus flavus TaxID=640084 RepID=A0ABW3PF24_9PROT
MAISINMQVGSTGGSSSSSGRGNSNTIEGLKKKLVALNQDLKSALGEQSEAGMQKAKNIQLQIQMAQMQLNQLVQQEAEKSKKALENSDASTQSVSEQIKRTNKQSQIDVFV